MNEPFSLIGSPVSTSGDTAVTALSAQGASDFGPVVLVNPSGSPAGQWSDDGFNRNIFGFAAGPSATLLFASGNLNNGIKVRRIPSGSDLANVQVIAK